MKLHGLGTDKRMNALVVINERKQGYMSELIEKIGHDFVDEFISVGFIICGYTKANKTWKVSELGEEFYAELK